MDNLEIGLFQLESLILTKSPFVFVNVGNVDFATGVDKRLNSYLQLAKLVHPDRLIDFLQSEKIDRQFPIVLLCEDGETSRRMARTLEAKGFGHVYVIEGGYQNLQREAQSL